MMGFVQCAPPARRSGKASLSELVLLLSGLLVCSTQAAPASPPPVHGRGTAAQTPTATASIVSESKVHVEEENWQKSEERVFSCTGLIHYAHELASIGLNESHLEVPIPCVPGDFDGNGYLDFAIWGDLYTRPGDDFKTRKFKTLFFEGPKIVKSQQIETPGADVLWLYRDTDSDTELDAPSSPYDGLMHFDQDGEANYFTYSSETKVLARYPSPDSWD
jgi:hypothetical protein